MWKGERRTARAYAMDALKRSMRWDEKAFGREYDLDVFNIVAVSNFNMGAMENKGLNIFNDKYILADPNTATDQDYAGIETVVAHEYFHNWTGNRITCRDWFQLCLKEGLTVYRDQEFSAFERDPTVKRIQDVQTLKTHQFPEDSGPLAHPVRPKAYREINNFYTATVYEKGAELVRMIATLLGPDGFRAGMDRYFRDFDGTAATVEDFLTSFEKATGADLSHFSVWYEVPGTPVVEMKRHYSSADKSLKITLRQENPRAAQLGFNAVLPIPIRFGLVSPRDPDTQETEAEPYNSEILLLDEVSKTFSFSNVSSGKLPSALRGFSAPVTMHDDLEQSEKTSAI